MRARVKRNTSETKPNTNAKNNYGYDREQKLLTIPLYFIPFVAKDLADGKMRV